MSAPFALRTSNPTAQPTGASATRFAPNATRECPDTRCVTAELAAFFDERIAAAHRHGPHFAELWSLAADHIDGGKLVRPLLLLRMHAALANDAAPGPAHSPARARLAAAVELLHFSFLLHDDVIDGDVLRRGRTNLIGSLAARATAHDTGLDSRPHDRLHWAQSGAILMGDLILAEVHQIFARLDVPGDQRIRLLDLLAHTITESVAGEQLDVGLSTRVVSPELSTILEMCRLKTAVYTFELPLRIAAVLAGADARAEEQLTAAGRHLGLAFQLHDDVLSTFGDPELHGKDPFSDLREGKETAIIAYARMTSAWGTIEPHFGESELTETRAFEVRDRLDECGARVFVEGLIDDELAALDAVLATAHLPDDAIALLRDLAGRLHRRTS